MAITKVLAAGLGPSPHVHGLLSPWTSSRAQRPRGATLVSRSPRTSPQAWRPRGRFWLPLDLVESANGRLVTMAVIGMFGQDGPTGSAWRDGALVPASPVHVSRTRQGVRGAVGFCNPAGLAAEGTKRTSVTIARPISSTTASRSWHSWVASLGSLDLRGSSPEAEDAGSGVGELKHGRIALAKKRNHGMLKARTGSTTSICSCPSTSGALRMILGVLTSKVCELFRCVYATATLCRLLRLQDCFGRCLVVHGRQGGLSGSADRNGAVQGP